MLFRSVLMPGLVAWSIIRLAVEDAGLRRLLEIGLAIIVVVALAIITAPYLHLDNWRFLWITDIADRLRGGNSGIGTKYPSVWTAFGNSLLIACTQMLLVVTTATAAGYYLSRFDFSGRAGYLKSLLVLHAFPAHTLIIPIFLLTYWEIGRAHV